MKTIVAIYEEMTDARAAIRELHQHGISEDDISIMATDPGGDYASDVEIRDEAGGQVTDGAVSGAIAGGALGGISGLLVSLGIVAIPGLGPVLVAGPLAATLIGAGIGAAAGGVIGALVGWGLPEEEAHAYAEGVRRGGTLVAAKVPDAHEAEAVAIMDRHRPIDINKRAGEWRAEGWTGFNAEGVEAPPRSPSAQQTNMLTYEEEVTRSMKPQFREHYEQTYGPSEFPFEYYETAYTHGYELGREDHDMTIEWPDLEGDAKTRWQGMEHDAEWDDIRDAVRHGWEQSRKHPVYRRHYEEVYADTDRPYEDYEPAYDFGYQMASHEQYRNREWADLQNVIRREWRTDEHDTSWDEVKEAVREGWHAGTGTSRELHAGVEEYDNFQPRYREHYQSNLAKTGRPYETYEPAYRFGFGLATEGAHRSRRWSDIEEEAAREWRAQHDEPWEDVKDAVRRGWFEVKQGVEGTEEREGHYPDRSDIY